MASNQIYDRDLVPFYDFMSMDGFNVYVSSNMQHAGFPNSHQMAQ